MSSRDMSPYYSRGNVAASILPRAKKPKDWRAGFNPIPETKLQRSGLRSKHLFAVVACLIVLWILAIATSVCNILLLVTLRINARGMESLQFLTDNLREPVTLDKNARGIDFPQIEPVVQFSGKEIHLGTVVTNHGTIGGYENRNLTVEAARVILSTKTIGNKENKIERNGSARLIVEDGRIRAEGVNDFVVKEPGTGRPLFSALRPRFQFSRKNIKKISAEQIVTNKVRSPVDKSLRFLVENLSFRGNEGNKFTSKTFRMSAQNTLSLRTSDSGSIRLSSGKGIYLNVASEIPISGSPALAANVLGYRVCACGKTDRLFVVQGNKPCNMEEGRCL